MNTPINHNIISLSDEELECMQETKLNLIMIVAFLNQHQKAILTREDAIMLVGTQITMINILETKIKKVSRA